jgi:murein DD-endopeptidase MepM/ murein hydrolase activator NlpD/SH3-like domain-containing protein
MKYLKWLILPLLFYHCNKIQQALNPSPYELYVKKIKKSDLHKTPMGEEWIEAGIKVFNDSITVSLPFSETGYFLDNNPHATSYRFDVREGQVLIINVAAQTEGKLFMDLFSKDDDEWDHVVYADSTLTIKHEFRKNKHCLIRLQPELLINAHYVINISLTPVLANPVSGASNRAIGSFYGDSRDGGNRRHEGIDIFAPKGTPVIAPADGMISRVSTSRLGGKVVWMRDADRNHSYYFAHLDSQLVSSGMRVKRFDTIGLVGNTGNARTTPPHLHFGIYRSGSKDPIDYVRSIPGAKEEEIDTTITNKIYHIVSTKANLRAGPGNEILAALERNTFVKVIGKSFNWFRVILPDNTEGYIFGSLIKPAEEGKIIALEEPEFLLSGAHEEAIPLMELPPQEVEVLAHFNDHQWIKTADGIKGWVQEVN